MYLYLLFIIKFSYNLIVVFMKFDLKKYVLLYTIGSFLGYLLETIFCFIKYNHYIIKKGMIFGPFKPLYGFGLIFIFLFYKYLKKKNKLFVFIAGILLGSIYEYSASLIETYILHTNSWDYSNFKYKLNGRIYLPYTILWGILIVVCIFYLFPLFIKLYNYLNTYKFSNIILHLLTIFMIFNLILTSLVLIRFGLRNNNIAPLSPIGKMIDTKYDNNYIKKTFPRLKPSLK